MSSTVAVVESVDLQSFWKNEVSRIDARLDALLPDVHTEPVRLHKAMRHAVLAPGKRLRPILAIAAYRACGGSEDVIYDPACALEMLHAYSLIHDDLPCMDDDDTRRGQPTVHVAFDEATAVLAGDALHALAFEVLAPTGPPGRRGEMVALVARAIGTTGMIGGQMADLLAEGHKVSETEITEIHRQKTGELISASVELGAHIAAADDRQLNSLRDYARPLGLGFQIVDDLLDIEGSPEATGKPVGSDNKNEKATYPGVVGVAGAHRKAAELIDDAKEALKPLGADSELLAAIADRVLNRDR